MTPDRWTRIDALFDEAIALPPAERDGFLLRVCADDSAMRAELAALLAAYDDAAGRPGHLVGATGRACHRTPSTTTSK
mgnify:CR=1 FL=1